MTTAEATAVQSTAEHWPVDAATYHGCRSHVSNSGLSDFIEDPILFHGRYVRGIWPKKSKAPMVKGTAVHENILLPGEFERRVLAIPRDVLSANGSKVGGAWKEFEAAHSDRLLLKADELAEVLAIVESLRTDETASSLLSRPGRCEHVLRWQCRESGLLRRAMLDYWIEADGLVLDLKAVCDVSPRGFANAVLDRGYHRQHIYYCDAVEELTGRRPAFVFVAVLNCPPYSVRCYELDERFVGLGTDEVRGGLRSLARLWGQPLECWRADCRHEIETLSPPNYAFNRSEWSLPQ